MTGHSTFEDLGTASPPTTAHIADWGIHELGPAMFNLADVFVARREHLAALVRRVQWRTLRITEASIRMRRGDYAAAG
eukprot:4835369-Lingulodinium_polyedra.AAC.1